MKDLQATPKQPPREAGAELLVLSKWEEFTGWFLMHTQHWPRSARFTLTQRLQNHALDITELLVVARYEPARRRRNLQHINLLLERMRHLLRLAREAQLASVRGHESALRGIDETGRMIEPPGLLSCGERRGRCCDPLNQARRSPFPTPGQRSPNARSLKSLIQARALPALHPVSNPVANQCRARCFCRSKIPETESIPTSASCAGRP
jgi:hypothetical protein